MAGWGTILATLKHTYIYIKALLSPRTGLLWSYEAHRAIETKLGSIKSIKIIGLTKRLAEVIRDMRLKVLLLTADYRKL